MGAAEAGIDSMFNGVVALFAEQGVQPRRLQIWKQKLQQRGGEIQPHLKSSVTHIFASDVKFLEDRVEPGHLRKLRAVLLKYEWLEDCLKAGHAVPTDPYLLLSASKTQNSPTSGESVPSSTFSDEVLASAAPSSVKLPDRADARKRRASYESDDEDFEKHQKVDGDWMSIIHKGRKAGVVGSEDTRSADADRGSVADNDSAGLTAEEPSQTELIYSPPNLNKNITDIFGELSTIYGDALGDDRRSYSYHKAVSVIEKLPFVITSTDEVKKLPSIGKSLLENIGEILITGTLAKLEHFKKDEKVRAITQLSAVWGIGPTTARKLYAKGHRTLHDLVTEESLTPAQRVGLKFHSDINKKIPRHEAQKMETLIRTVAESIDRNVIIVCGGSYRRGKAFVGDMDMIITHPDGQSHVGFLRKLLLKLKEMDFITEDLRSRVDHDHRESEEAVDTYFGLCKYPGREQRHRIDFKVYPYWKYPFGLIAWTGNDVLNRRLRILAAEKRYKLDDLGCFPVTKDANGEDVTDRSRSVPLKSEREVFDFVGFQWLEPHERNL